MAGAVRPTTQVQFHLLLHRVRRREVEVGDVVLGDFEPHVPANREVGPQFERDLLGGLLVEIMTDQALSLHRHDTLLRNNL